VPKDVSEFSFWVVTFSKTEEMGGAHRGVVVSKFLGESDGGKARLQTESESFRGNFCF